MSKNADRAHTERVLEDMMNNDWRVFRAKLVAQEQVEARELAAASLTDGSSIVEHTAGEAQLGSRQLIATPELLLTHQINQMNAHPVYKGQIQVLADDPFASEDELPLTSQPMFILDKHRWAHPISHIEPGCVLIANEKLGGVFHHAVVLITGHSENGGSTGIVINRPLEGNLLKVASETSSRVDLSVKLAFASAIVSNGGPVKQEEYTVLHSYGEVEGAKKICPGVFIGGSEELMKLVRINRFDPSECLFVKGHSIWVPQQLTREISKNVWYVAAVSNDFILRYAGAPRHTRAEDKDNLWAEILTCMSGRYAATAKKFAGCRDNRKTARSKAP